MITFETFRQSCLDLSVLGLQDRPSSKSLASEKANVLAWLENSPIHFCQFPDQETVFVVDPQGLPEEQIIPVAEDIESFIGLLICCKDADLIAKAYQWSSLRFRELMEAIVPGIKKQSVLRALENIYHPAVIEDAAKYMLQLRQTFAGPQNSQWHVAFDQNFASPCSSGGQEVTTNRCLVAESGIWHVPSVFLWEEGIVVETYLEVSAADLQNFRKNWSNSNETVLSIGDKLQRELDDPLTTSVMGILEVNDKPLRCKSTFSTVWNPLEENPPDVRRLLNHYRLDPDQGYLFKRYSFLRKGKQPKIRTMQLTLESIPVMVPVECFTVDKEGQRFRFTHPATGLEHIFTAVSMTSDALNPNFLTNHPCFYHRLNYTLEPSISADNFQVVDRHPSDDWEDYQDDPAAVIFWDRKPDRGRYALSSLHYVPQDQVQWQIIIRRKLHKDMELKLFP